MSNSRTTRLERIEFGVTDKIYDLDLATIADDCGHRDFAMTMDALQQKWEKAEGEVTELCEQVSGFLKRFQYDEAVAASERACSLCRTHLGEGHSKHVVLLNNLGLAYMGRGDLSDAQSVFKEALRKARKSHLSYGAILSNLGMAYEATNQYDKAVSAYEKAVSLVAASSRDHLLGPRLLRLANIYKMMNQFDDAERTLKKGLRELQTDHHMHGIIMRNLASLYRDRRRPELAMQFDSLAGDNQSQEFLGLFVLGTRKRSRDSRQRARLAKRLTKRAKRSNR